MQRYDTRDQIAILGKLEKLDELYYISRRNPISEISGISKKADISMQYR